jgi:hypothetical protein
MGRNAFLDQLLSSKIKVSSCKSQILIRKKNVLNLNFCSDFENTEKYPKFNQKNQHFPEISPNPIIWAIFAIVTYILHMIFT